MPNYGYSSPSAGNPAWPSIVMLLGVPVLVMDPEMGLWPRAGSTQITILKKYDNNIINLNDIGFK